MYTREREREIYSGIPRSTGNPPETLVVVVVVVVDVKCSCLMLSVLLLAQRFSVCGLLVWSLFKTSIWENRPGPGEL